MTRKISFLLLLILLSSAIYAQQITQQFSFSQNDVQPVKSGEYDIVSLPETDFLQGEENAGKPQLPVKYFKLLLPQGASATNVSISINSEQQLQGNFYLFPVQMPLYTNFDDPPAFVEPDPTIYNSNNPFPENYIVNYETSGYRDYNYVTVSFIPFRYIPLSRQLHLLTNVTITVNYSVNTLNEVHKLRPYGEIDETAYNFVKQSVINPLQIDAYYPETSAKINQYKATKGSSATEGRAYEPAELPALEGSAVLYVIITNNTKTTGENVGDFTGKFQEFADWKTQSGTPAKVITVDAIRNAYPGVDIAEKIREFIKDAYKL